MGREYAWYGEIPNSIENVELQWHMKSKNKEMQENKHLLTFFCPWTLDYKSWFKLSNCEFPILWSSLIYTSRWKMINAGLNDSWPHLGL